MVERVGWKAKAPHFYGSTLPPALKSKKTVVLTYTQKDNVESNYYVKFF